MTSPSLPSVQAKRKSKVKPWKTIGYRGFSAFLASDNDFLIFRRFGALNARLLLFLQDEISSLEQHLDVLESSHSHSSARDIHNGTFRHDELPDRTRLLRQIHSKIREYSKYK
jgi:hypothetical protein